MYLIFPVKVIVLVLVIVLLQCISCSLIFQDLIKIVHLSNVYTNYKKKSEQQELFTVNILIVFFAEKKEIDKQEIELSS